MATYILLLTLTPDGQEKALQDPHYILHVERSIQVSGVQTMGIYGVLGDYDFVTIVSAPDNEAIGRFSIELGVRAGVHVTSLPALALSGLEQDTKSMSAEAKLTLVVENEAEVEIVPGVETRA